VWQDAIELYRLTVVTFCGWPFELKRVAGQAIASADSVHRNISEGYCRRSLNEYLQFLNFALGSLGECVSGQFAYHKAGQLTPEEFERLDAHCFKLAKWNVASHRKSRTKAQRRRQFITRTERRVDSAMKNVALVFFAILWLSLALLGQIQIGNRNRPIPTVARAIVGAIGVLHVVVIVWPSRRKQVESTDDNHNP
jgi:four helix bundle protein